MTKPSEPSQALSVESQLQRGSEPDPILAELEQKGRPLTRESYLLAAGLSEPLDAEIEVTLPPSIQRTSTET